MKNNAETDDASFTIKEMMDQLDERLNDKGTWKKNQDKKKPEIAFAISLKSKTVSLNWERVQDNLSKTLRSILRNSDQHYRILIAGHEKPDITELQNDRVTWLPVDFPPPADTYHFSPDKMNKRRVMGAYLRDIGYSGYFMPIDADDWVHYRFVEFIRSHPITDAFILDKGIMANTSLHEAWLRKGFYRGCGSSAVYYFSNHDLPATSRREDVQHSLFGLSIMDHKTVGSHLVELNKDYTMIDFPLVTWVLGHGDNNSVLKGKKNNGISAKDYRTHGEELEEWFYDYFKIRK